MAMAPLAEAAFDWDMFLGVVTAITGMLIFATVVVLGKQLSVMRRSAAAAAFDAVVARIQEEDLRAARRVVFGLKGKPMSDWSRGQKRAAERVICSYDVAGIMAKSDAFPVDWLTDNWAYSLSELWPICKFHVEACRRERGVNSLWIHFEWLAGLAVTSRQPSPGK